MEGEKVCFLGERKILPSNITSVLTATKMLKRGCEAFLAHVVSVETNAPNLANISMVRRFSDVFSEDLPRLSLVRELEFDIDLAADTRPISRVPYRMALPELKELNTQLQELLDKGLSDPVCLHGMCQYYLSKRRMVP